MSLKELVSCKYLGGPFGRANCRSCTNHTELKIFKCKIYGKCTISKEIEGTSCCKTCPLNMFNEIPEEKNSNMSQIVWQYGVTTVPQRKDRLLIQTLTSLREAGFTTPYLYVDGGYEGHKHIGPGIQTAGITYRYPSVGVYGNWIMSLSDLFIRNPRADRYCLFQDDILCIPNAREYLDSCEFPDKGYLNLYSSTPQNEVLLVSKGWHKSNQMGRGALGLVLNNRCVKDLLMNQSSLKYLTDKPNWAGIRANRNVDGMICECLKPLGYTEFIHCPSILQHTGIQSTIGNHSCGAKTFDPNFNLLSLLK